MATWEDIYKKKVMKPAQAIRMIKTGAPRIFIGTGCGQPQTLVEELANPNNAIKATEVKEMLDQEPPQPKELLKELLLLENGRR